MDCKLDKALLQDLIEGVIDPVERVFVEEHLKNCKECRREMTELKLLFWELDNKVNYEVEIPEELDLIRNSLLESVAENAPKSTSGMVIEQQRKNIKATGAFLEYIPGVKESGKLVKEGAKAAPSAIGKASMGLIKGAKMLLAR